MASCQISAASLRPRYHGINYRPSSGSSWVHSINAIKGKELQICFENLFLFSLRFIQSLWVPQHIRRWMVGWSLNKELERMREKLLRLNWGIYLVCVGRYWGEPLRSSMSPPRFVPGYLLNSFMIYKEKLVHMVVAANSVVQILFSPTQNNNLWQFYTYIYDEIRSR